MKHALIEKIPVTDNHLGVDALEVTAYYSYSYQNAPRGYYISVIPVKYIDRGNYRMTESNPIIGIKKCFIECTRQSKKKEQMALQADRSHYQDLIDYVLNKTGLKLAERINYDKV